MAFHDQLEQLLVEAKETLAHALSLDDVDALEIRFLGRKGELTNLLKMLATVSAEERPRFGALANEAKKKIEAFILSSRDRLSAQEATAQFAEEREDVTEPGTRPPEGHLHLMTQAIREITDIFAQAGFTRVRYPEVEWDWYAFEALNMPKDHPARDDWETFFMDAPTSAKWGRMLLTPHATSGTARQLAEQKPPIRTINISKTYRRQIDVTHVPVFHQFDGVYADKGVSITHLRGVLDYFARAFFGPGRKTRLRPHHFRFTEPSFEIDVSCGVCGGTGMMGNKEKCRTCKQGWLELGGAGMLHPSVLKAAGLDPSVYSGLAFGWGVERTYMMKEGMRLDDMRVLYKNDLRFLQQF